MSDETRSKEMTDLEERLFVDIQAGREVSLEEALLIVSGLKTVEEVEQYIQKLVQILEGFVEKIRSKTPLGLPAPREYLASDRAQLLFEYLWNTKPRRCDSDFLLTDVIEAQLNPDINRRVGSCVGLTSLYTVLGLRIGLELTILVSDSHLMNRLRVGEHFYDIDNTDPLGFSYDLSGKHFIEYPAWYLLANVMNSRGLTKEKMGNLEGARNDYRKAVTINLGYANPYNNLGNIKFKYADFVGAIEDYGQALDLYPDFVEAYCNRGLAKDHLGDYRSATEDFDRAIAMDPEYLDAYLGRGIAKEGLGDYAGAIEDFGKVTELDPESRDQMVRSMKRAERLLKNARIDMPQE
jgi:tetratricopeptide (TPR) repeat protein